MTPIVTCDFDAATNLFPSVSSDPSESSGPQFSSRETAGTVSSLAFGTETGDLCKRSNSSTYLTALCYVILESRQF